MKSRAGDTTTDTALCLLQKVLNLYSLDILEQAQNIFCVTVALYVQKFLVLLADTVEEQSLFMGDSQVFGVYHMFTVPVYLCGTQIRVPLFKC